MLVLHANWSEGALKLWAESLEAYVGRMKHGADAAALGADAGPADPAASGNGEAEAAPAAGSPQAVDRHPFTLDAAALEMALVSAGLLEPGDVAEHRSRSITLHLPTCDAVPMPSDRLAGAVGSPPDSEEWRIGRYRVEALPLKRDRTLARILALESAGPSNTVEFAHSLRYWMIVVRFVVEQLADQRFIPSLRQSAEAALEARWQLWLHEESARKRVGDLLAGMPPVARAVDDCDQRRPWQLLSGAISALTNAAVRRVLIDDDYIDALDGRDPDKDLQVAWLAGLLGEANAVELKPARSTELLRDVGRWIAGLDQATTDQPFRLCFELDEPDLPEPSAASDGLTMADAPIAAKDLNWRLTFHLASTAGDGHVISAEALWNDPTSAGTAGLRHPDEFLLHELGRAARIYDLLEASLEHEQPTHIELTTNQAYAFMAEISTLLDESGFQTIVPDWWGSTSARLGVRLVLESPPLEEAMERGGTSAAGSSLLGLNSLVHYRWQVAIGDRPISFAQFQELLKQKSALVRLGDAWVELHPDQLAEAASFFDEEAEGEMTLLQAVQQAHGWAGKPGGLSVNGLDATGWVDDLLAASTNAERMPRLDQPEDFQGSLRPYQKTGLSWLAYLDSFGLGACLADDMGLGKTIQLIALLQMERQREPEREFGPTLLVAPTSVISNWHRELERFAPGLSVLIHHGPERHQGEQFVRAASDHDVVITTYTLISRDADSISKQKWHRVVLDEAQYIKNPPTKQTATIRALETHRRIALTGTPVENRLSELWSIMEFCNPGYLGSSGEFRRRFAVPVERHRNAERADQLRRLVRPFILRRLKTDPNVIGDLPSCVTTREFATLSDEQASQYEQTVNRMLDEVGSAEGIQRRGLVLATLVKLKQICNHPALVRTNEEGDGAPQTPAARAAEVLADNGNLALLSRRSGKSMRLMEMLEEVVATGDKALIFTQFRQMGHLLSSMIQHDLDAEVLFLHGGTPAAKRQEMIDRFQDPDGGVPLFILSLKAGGLGLNLTAANHVFHFDRWWNPAVEKQATDRAFRIGQTRTVHVHKFVCMGTLEERIDQMLEQKTELAENIIGAGEDWLTELSTGELRDLLALQRSIADGEAEERARDGSPEEEYAS